MAQDLQKLTFAAMSGIVKHLGNENIESYSDDTMTLADGSRLIIEVREEVDASDTFNLVYAREVLVGIAAVSGLTKVQCPHV